MTDNLKIELLKDDDIDDVNRLYNSVNASNRTREKFRWEFLEGPAGPAIYVVAKDSHLNRIVGTQCAIPLYILKTNNERVLTAKSEDTLVDPAYRGKNIFEKMYALLFEECNKAGINFIWGFTYAIKPFKKIGFQTEIQSDFGLACRDFSSSYNYLKSLGSDRSFIKNLKIFSLVTFSKLNSFKKINLLPLKDYTFQSEKLDDMNIFISETIEKEEFFFLSQDNFFLDWRIYKNPYQLNFLQFVLKNEQGQNIAHIICSISNSGIAYIIQMTFSRKLPNRAKRTFLKKTLTELMTSSFIVRFWGFKNNIMGFEDIKLLRSVGFVFVNRGITLVWKSLRSDVKLDPSDMILSRMASQGTN